MPKHWPLVGKYDEALPTLMMLFIWNARVTQLTVEEFRITIIRVPWVIWQYKKWDCIGPTLCSCLHVCMFEWDISPLIIPCLCAVCSTVCIKLSLINQTLDYADRRRAQIWHSPRFSLNFCFDKSCCGRRGYVSALLANTHLFPHGQFSIVLLRNPFSTVFTLH